MKRGQFLEKVLEEKRREVDRLVAAVESNPAHPISHIFHQICTPKHHFSSALKGAAFAVIAEVKRRSPPASEEKKSADLIAFSLQCCRGGASAVSVVTDSIGYGGSLDDLREVAAVLALQYPQVAVLRNDFIIHPIQLAEAAYAGAHAVVLMAHLLKSELKLFIQEARCLGLETLTEVHDLADLECAIAAGAPIIAINRRNLETYEIDRHISQALRPLVPPHVITVAASGIVEPKEAEAMRLLGFDAVMVGEALMRSLDPGVLIQQMMKRET